MSMAQAQAQTATAMSMEDSAKDIFLLQDSEALFGGFVVLPCSLIVLIQTWLFPTRIFVALRMPPKREARV